MNKIDRTVWKETGNTALWVAGACAVIQAVCLIAGWWSLSVLLGSLLGGSTAVGNFFLMGLMIQKALGQEKKQATNTVRLSQGLRLLMQGVILVLGAIFLNIWATAIPLLVPRAAISLRQLITKAPAAPVTTTPDEEDDEE